MKRKINFSVRNTPDGLDVRFYFRAAPKNWAPPTGRVMVRVEQDQLVFVEDPKGYAVDVGKRYFRFTVPNSHIVKLDLLPTDAVGIEVIAERSDDGTIRAERPAELLCVRDGEYRPRFTKQLGIKRAYYGRSETPAPQPKVDTTDHQRALHEAYQRGLAQGKARAQDIGMVMTLVGILLALLGGAAGYYVAHMP